MPTKSTKKRVVAAAAGVTAVVALVGLGHAPFARSLLMKVGGCPVGRASAAEIEDARSSAVASMRGSAPAPARPALGFALDRTTPEEVHAWSQANAIACVDKREGMLIACKEVPASALRDGRDRDSTRVDEVMFAFRPADRALVNVTAVRFAVDARSATREMTTTVSRLSSALGPPATSAGDVDEARFARGGYATSTVSYRFIDYVAEVSATSIDGRGVMLREHHLSATSKH